MRPRSHGMSAHPAEVPDVVEPREDPTGSPGGDTPAEAVEADVGHTGAQRSRH